MIFVMTMINKSSIPSDLCINRSPRPAYRCNMSPKVSIFLNFKSFQTILNIRDRGSIVSDLAMTVISGTSKEHANWESFDLIDAFQHTCTSHISPPSFFPQPSDWGTRSPGESTCFGLENFKSFFRYINLLVRRQQLFWGQTNQIYFDRLAALTEQQLCSVSTTMPGPGLFFQNFSCDFDVNHDDNRFPRLWLQLFCQATPDGRLQHKPPVRPGSWSVVMLHFLTNKNPILFDQ